MVSRLRKFSVRTLLIFVTIAAAYFACWPATTKWGVPEVAAKHGGQATAMAPLVVQSRRVEMLRPTANFMHTETTTQLHLWCFGPTVDLPFCTTTVMSLALSGKASTGASSLDDLFPSE